MLKQEPTSRGVGILGLQAGEEVNERTPEAQRLRVNAIAADSRRVRRQQSQVEREIRAAVLGLHDGWLDDQPTVENYLYACRPTSIRVLLAELNRLRRMLP